MRFPCAQESPEVQSASEYRAIRESIFFFSDFSGDSISLHSCDEFYGIQRERCQGYLTSDKVN